MQVVRLADVPLEDLKDTPRDGKFMRRRLLEGTSGSPDNFLLEEVRTFGDFFSPRHRHNFDQIRVQLEGTFDFDRNGKMKPGMIGYFPEAAYYGPQSSSEDSRTIVLQFGGASGSGYMSAEQFHAGIAELKKFGEFRKGAYTRVLPDGRKINKDGYQATWEHVNGRALVYPEARYQDPILMAPASYAWVADDGADGVARKRLGVFTECEMLLDIFRLEAAATLRLDAGSIYLVTAGSGRAGSQAFEQYSTLYVPRGEEGGDITADVPSELLRIGLPDVARSMVIERDRLTALAG